MEEFGQDFIQCMKSKLEIELIGVASVQASGSRKKRLGFHETQYSIMIQGVDRDSDRLLARIKRKMIK